MTITHHWLSITVVGLSAVLDKALTIEVLFTAVGTGKCLPVWCSTAMQTKTKPLLINTN